MTAANIMKTILTYVLIYNFFPCLIMYLTFYEILKYKIIKSICTYVT